jgi:hypothetical protein
MNTTYAQKSSPVQKAADSKAASVLDSSAQSESLQRKADMTNAAVQRAEAPRPNNTGMPDNLKSGIESLSGFSMDDVRVHYNSSKPATVQALAYTQGTDIHVAPGQEKCLPHEAWHVAQQMAGRVSPTTNINGMPVNDNAALEHEADVMGAKATQMKSDESKTVQRATIWNGVAQRVELKDYYYHISQEGIPEKAKIDPMFNNNPKARAVRGDDLGPGFYMGDSNFLPYYYKKNFIDSKKLHIYYIEKKMVESENMKRNTTNFTENNNMFQITENNDLFQIAMQLGFRYVKENDVNNHQRPLDLLDPKKTDALALEKMRKFKECVEEIYGREAQKISVFFEIANGKAIWKGYINNIDDEPFQITLEEGDIKAYFLAKSRFKALAESLAQTLPKNFRRDSYNQLYNESIAKIIEICKKNSLKITSLDKKEISEDYEVFLKRRKHYTYNYMGKETDVKPIQIAIRKDVTYNENDKEVSLLEKIKSNEIPITKDDIESTRKLIAAGTKSGTEGDAENEGPKPEPLKPAETEPVTNGDAKNEGSKQELLKTAGTESATSKDLKSELNAAGTKSETELVPKPEENNPVAKDDPKTKGAESGDEKKELKEKIKIVLAVAKQEKIAEDSSSENE